MSYTELFGLTKDSTENIGETRNAWRGAMAVWVILEKKYLPKFIPDWAIGLGGTKQEEGYSRTSTFGENSKMGEIWGLINDSRLSRSEKIVLASTFDNVLAKVDTIDQVLLAFREFNGETSLREQADVIEQAIKGNPELIAIGWNQTSVNGDTWGTENLNEETEEYTGYNIETGTRHWFLIEEIDKSEENSIKDLA